MKLFALLLAALLMGCNQSSAPPASDSLEVRFWHDDARHVGCWIWYPAATGRSGISCLPDAQYTTPSAQNAPTPSALRPGRPETPGVAPMSTSAPRSAPEQVVGAMAIPVGVATQERTGAPTLGREAVVRGTGHGPPRRNEGSSPLGAPHFARTGIGTAAGALRGTARWFATGPNGVAAAGPRLRAALGSHWRGTLVGVTYRGKTVWARLSDWCACGSGSIIDLPDEVFARFAPLSRGVLAVTVHWGDRNTLPATDTAP